MTYRFGCFSIDEGERLLLRGGTVAPLTPKAADLLLLLLSVPGHVFEKQHILDAVWNGAFVEEGNISQTVSHLRKALRDSAENPTYIETIPKRGYRWIAPLHPAAPYPVRAAPRRWVVVTICAALCVAAGTFLIRGGGTPVEAKMRPFTSLRGGEYGPALSRDGQRVAFVWKPEQSDHFDVYVRSVDGEDQSAVTSDAPDEASVCWSPDGNSLAFLRYGDGFENAVVVRSLRTGVEQTIARVHPVRQVHDRLVDWSPTGDDLAISDRAPAEEPYAIYLVSIANGERKRLTTPPPGSRGDTGAVFSRDGRSLAFRRTLTAGVTDIYVVPVSGGEPVRVTFDGVHTSAHDWTSDGREIVFSSSRAGGFALWRVSAAGGKPKPVSVPPHGANFLSIAGERLALSLWFADTNIWRYRLDEPHDRPSAPLIASTRSDISPQYSPGGEAIAFRSNREGADEIWIAKGDGSGERCVTNFDGPLTGSPRWSPDGRRIAFDSRPGGKANIYVVDRAGATRFQVSAGSGDHVVPSWSGDGQFIYFSSNRTGAWQIWRAAAEPHSGADGAVQVTHHGGFAPFESPDGRFVYYAKGENTAGLWRVALPDGEEELFSTEPAAGLWGQWALTKHALYLVEVDKRSARLIRIDYGSKSKTVVRDLPVRPFWNDGGLAVSPAGPWFLYAQADTSGSDIYVVDRFR